MLKRTLIEPPEHVFPTDPWRIVETRFDERFVARLESVFALSNGYLGIRGTPDEGLPAPAPGTLVGGFHETWPIFHAEEAFGLAHTGQTIVTVPDATVFRLYVDDEPLYLPTARLRGYRRVLDMRAGTLTRELQWTTPAGKHVHVRSSRLVSLEHRHLLAIEYQVMLTEHAAPIAIASRLVNHQRSGAPVTGARIDPRTAPRLPHQVLLPEVVREDADRFLLGYRTANSGMTLGVGVHHLVQTSARYETSVTLDGDSGELLVTANLEPGVLIRIVKYAAYQSSRSAPPQELVERCGRTLDRAQRAGPDGLRSAQRLQLDRYWDRADVRVAVGERTDRIQQAIRWNLFQIAQATWRAEGSGVPAKGLTGMGYEGHYFWDTEIYVLPLLAYTQPRIARNLLRFRHSLLPRARERARVLGHRGATFAWRTINGEEASAYYQAGTAQYHLNADIAYAIQRYVTVRDDPGFLVEVGAEILVETARMWEDLGFHAGDGYFHIHGVTGPDEYTAVVNDNAYTNLMARLNLSYAAECIRRLATEQPAVHAALVDDLGLRPEEVEAWERAASAMFVPFDEERGIHPQDTSFLEREVWDLDATPPERFPLMLHHHPLEIYRHQVIKQADVVLAMVLLGDGFSQAQKRANFEYYDALTTGDSSLSASMQSIIAAEVGDEDRALNYFTFALLMDLGDAAGNTSDGIHIACAAGVWQALVFGFGGVRDFGGRLSISPHLPSAWESLDFSLRFRGRQLRVRLRHEDDEIRLDEGAPLEIVVRGRPRLLTTDQPVVTSAARG